MTRVLITGGSGFLGTNLVAALLAVGHDVQNVDLVSPKCADHLSVWKKVDLRDRRAVSESFRTFEPQSVYHLAARTDLIGTALSDYAANVDGVRNVVDAVGALRHKPRTVYASSRLVFDITHRPTDEYDYNPSTVYGQSKVAGELYVRERAHLGGDWCLVRPTSLWGPWFGTPYREFFENVRRGTYVQVMGQDPRKSFGYVGNAVHALIRLAVAPSTAVNGRVFWLADYKPIVLSKWAATIAEAMDRPAPRRVPKFFVAIAAQIGDVLQELGYANPPITSFRLNNLLADMVYETASLEAVVGSLPFSLREGVAETVAWLDGLERD